MTQSAVSAALGRLRTLYGDPLFTRTGRGLAPSLRARELRPVIGEALDKCRQSLALARPGRAGVAGRSVTLGLSDDFEIALGRDIMDRLAVEAPGLRVIFRQTHSGMAADMLMAREADLVIASGGLSAASLRKALAGRGGYACLLDPASLRRGQKTLSVEEFVRREHVLVSSGGFIGVVDEVLHGMGLKRRAQASTTHFSALAFFTLPEHAARGLARAAGLALLPCPVDMPDYAIELGWRADVLRDPAASALRRCCRCLRPIAGALDCQRGWILRFARRARDRGRDCRTSMSDGWSIKTNIPRRSMHQIPPHGTCHAEIFEHIDRRLNNCQSSIFDHDHAPTLRPVLDQFHELSCPRKVLMAATAQVTRLFQVGACKAFYSSCRIMSPQSVKVLVADDHPRSVPACGMR